MPGLYLSQHLRGAQFHLAFITRGLYDITYRTQ
jgi:hypothetical protein